MELRVLGALELRESDGPSDLPSGKPRALLALLAIRPNEVVATDRLVDELWAGEPPASAPTALRVHMSKLREAIEPGRPRNAPSGRLPGTPGGYCLRLVPDELDSQRFEQLVNRARGEVADGAPADAVVDYEAALALWHGPAFADVRDVDALRSTIVRLEELKAQCFEELADASLALRRHATLIDRLQVAVDEHPLRERLAGQLMLALYRSGRQADALRVYSQLRRRLDELGIEPGAELQALEQAVLLQEPELAAPPTVADVDRPRVPRLAARRRGAPLVDRRAELEELAAVWRDVAEGGRRFLLVSGPAGIGKTALASALASDVELEGGHVLWSECRPDVGGDLGSVVEIVRARLALEPGDVSTDLPREVAALLPEVGRDAPDRPDVGGEGGRYALFESVAELFFGDGARSFLVVVDDVQWADRATLLLLRHLVRHPSVTRLMVLATLRDDEASDAVEFWAAERVDEVELRGFDSHEVDALVRSVGASDVVEHVLPRVAAVHDLTRGNRLFVRELLRELAQVPVGDDLDDVLAEVAPGGVRDLVTRRVARLSADARTVVRVGAVAGADFVLPVVGPVARLDEDHVLAALEESLAVGLVVEDPQVVDRFSFSHPLVRNAVYRSLTTSRRVRLHRRVGEVLEPTGADAVTLAHHFVTAAPTGVQKKAAAYARDAGAEAMARYAYEEAARWHELALDLAGPAGWSVAEVGESQLSRGRALELSGRTDDARAAFLLAADAARTVPGGVLLADVTVAASGPWVRLDEFQPTLAQLADEALVALTPDDGRRRVEVLACKANAIYFSDPASVSAIAREALELGHALGEPSALAAGLGAWHRALYSDPGAIHTRLDAARERVQVTNAPGVVGANEAARRQLLSDLLETGAFEEFACHLEDYERLADASRLPAARYWSVALRATKATLEGALEVAEQYASGARELGERLGQPRPAGAWFLHLFLIRYEQGRLRELQQAFSEAPDEPRGVLAGLGLHAFARAELGDTAAARSIVSRVTEGATVLPLDSFRLGGLALLAGAAAMAGALDALEPLATMLGPYAEQWVVFGSGGAVLGTTRHWLGQLAGAAGEWDDAEHHLTVALERCTEIDAPYWAAQARLDLANVLAARAAPGDTERSAGLARSVAEVARTRGFGRLLPRAELLSA